MSDPTEPCAPGAPRVRSLGSGLDNDAYLVDDLVLRFSRDPADADVRREAGLLAVVARHSPLPVPLAVVVDAARGCLAYPVLPGTPLLDLPERPDVAAVLAGFVRAVQGIPLAEVADLVDVEDEAPTDWLARTADAWPAVRADVPARHHAAVQRFLATPPPAPAERLVLAHFDLGAEHVLVDEASGTVTGIIDFTDAAIADPACDYALLVRDLGPAAVRAVTPSELWERAVFYARCAALGDLAHGLRTGDQRYTGNALAALDRLF